MSIKSHDKKTINIKDISPTNKVRMGFLVDEGYDSKEIRKKKKTLLQCSSAEENINPIIGYNKRNSCEQVKWPINCLKKKKQLLSAFSLAVKNE
jgi:hypothetical protein